MKIKTVSKILVMSLLVVNLLILGVGRYWFQGYTKLETQWTAYNKSIELKSDIIHVLQDHLGPNGIAMYFGHYLKGGNAKYLIKFQELIVDIDIAVTTYQGLNISAKERMALQKVSKGVKAYLDSAKIAQQKMGDHLAPEQISQQFNVDIGETFTIVQQLSRTVKAEKANNIHAISQQVALIDRRSVYVAGFITFLLFGLAVYFYWFMNKRMILPINALLAALEKIDVTKDATKRLPVEQGTQRTELDELASSANRFIEVVEQQIDSLSQAEQQAKESEHRISTILQNTGEGIITIDNRGTILSYNPKCEEVFGYTTSEVLGQNINYLMRKEERKAHDEYLRKVKIFEKRIINANRELWGQRKSGDIFPLELTVSSVNLQGQTCYIGILHDISQRKANEQKLLDAKLEAESASQAKSQFISAISHELRTPLNAILGFSQLLMLNAKEPLSVLQKSNTEQILKAGEHLLALINDILDLSNIELGNFKVEFEQVGLSLLIDECLQLVEHQALSKGISIEVDRQILTTDKQLYTSFTRLKQVILNLLTNAIKYNVPEGKVSIKYVKHSARYVRIEISDTGVGIAKENYDKVFEPFARFDDRAIQIDGNGIGLSVSASLVEALHGTIDFISEVGKGTTFILMIPAYEPNNLNLITDIKAPADNHHHLPQ